MGSQAGGSAAAELMENREVPNPVPRASRVWDAKRQVWVCCVMVTFRGTYELKPGAADEHLESARSGWRALLRAVRDPDWVAETFEPAMESCRVLERHARSLDADRRVDGQA